MKGNGVSIMNNHPMYQLFGVSVLLGAAVCAYGVATREPGPIAMDLPMPTADDLSELASGDPLLDLALREVVMPVLDIVVPRPQGHASRVIPCTRTVQPLGVWADMHTGPNLNHGQAGTVTVTTGGCPTSSQ